MISEALVPSKPIRLHTRPANVRRNDQLAYAGQRSTPLPSDAAAAERLLPGERILQALAALGYPSLKSVNCEVTAERIVLSGAVPSYHLKQVAQEAALRVAGPRRVDNRVVVTSL
jgi:hypothetical protein